MKRAKSDLGRLSKTIQALSLTGITNIDIELSRARTELVFLEEKARDLLKQFFDVRATIAAQRAKINYLVRRKPTAINNLPTELLTSILCIDSKAFWHRSRKWTLASVCRHWRDVIIDNPVFWTTIYLPSSRFSITTHLERSRESLFDIVVHAETCQPLELPLASCLDMVLSHAHRWHSLFIDSTVFYGQEASSLTSEVSERMNNLDFPSLKRVMIETHRSHWSIARLRFICSARSPALEHLGLMGLTATPTDFSPLALKTLELNSAGYISDPGIRLLSLPTLIQTQLLVKLSLAGKVDGSGLRPNSIPFPVLHTLEISNVPELNPFMDAIIAPNLEWFDYDLLDHSGDLPSATFDRLDSKFANVRHLFFSWTPMDSDAPDPGHVDALALCQAFPGVRHLTLRGRQLPYLFEWHDSTRSRRFIDSWAELESLTLHGLHYYWTARDRLLGWLVNRRALGLQLLRVKFAKQSFDHVDTPIRTDYDFIMLYEQLKENCILELHNFELRPKMYLSMTEGSPLRVVSNASLTIEHHFHHHTRV